VEAMGRDFLALAEGPAESGPLWKFSDRSAADFLAGYTREPRLQAILCSLWPLAGLPPAQLSAVQFAALWHTFHQQGGTCAVRGGMKVFGQALADVIIERGGTVSLRTPVQRILIDRRRATGVELGDGTRVACDAVIANVNPQDLFEQLLPGGEGPPLRYPPLDGTTSISAMQIHLGVEMPIDVPARTSFYHTTTDLSAAFADLQRAEPEFSSFVVTVLDQGDPDRVPAGKHMVVLMALQPYARGDHWNAPFDARRGPAYRTLPEYVALKDRIGDRLVQAAEAVIPGLGAHVVVRKVATPVTMERYTFNTGGAAFGWANIHQQCGANRPGPKTPVRGLYLAGHWTFPGSGVSAAMISGQLAANAALRAR